MKYRGLLLPMILAAMCGDDAFMLMLVFSFLLKGAPACEGMRSLYLYNA